MHHPQPCNTLDASCTQHLLQRQCKQSQQSSVHDVAQQTWGPSSCGVSCSQQQHKPLTACMLLAQRSWHRCRLVRCRHGSPAASTMPRACCFACIQHAVIRAPGPLKHRVCMH
jgi:hypothetical protein